MRKYTVCIKITVLAFYPLKKRTKILWFTLKINVNVDNLNPPMQLQFYVVSVNIKKKETLLNGLPKPHYPKILPLMPNFRNVYTHFQYNWLFETSLSKLTTYLCNIYLKFLYNYVYNKKFRVKQILDLKRSKDSKIDLKRNINLRIRQKNTKNTYIDLKHHDKVDIINRNLL